MPSFKFKITQSSGTTTREKDPYFLGSLVVFLGLGIISFLVILYFRSRLPAEVPIFYSRAWGESRLAAKDLLLILPVGNLLLGIFNLGYSVRFKDKEIIISRILQGLTVLLTVVTLLATINIIKLIL